MSVLISKSVPVQGMSAVLPVARLVAFYISTLSRALQLKRALLECLLDSSVFDSSFFCWQLKISRPDSVSTKRQSTGLIMA